MKPGLKNIFEASLANHWSPYKLKARCDVKYSALDLEMLSYFLVPLAYGEATAAEAFIPRFAQAAHHQDLRLWMMTHMLDEARHSIAFERYLSQLYHTKQLSQGFSKRYFVRFYGALKRMDSVEDWVFSTLVVESFGRAAYKSLRTSIPDSAGRELCSQILLDESRHVGFLTSFLSGLDFKKFDFSSEQRINWKKMIFLGANMFLNDGDGPTLKGFKHFSIPIEEICEETSESLSKLVNKF